MSETKTFTLPDERTLAYAIYGTTTGGPSTPTILYLHGFPGSHHEAALFAPAAAHHGLRIVAPSRPGFGGSSPHPARRIADFPADALALLDHLSVRAFAVLAISAGSAYALTLAARPDAAAAGLRGIAILSGLYPAKLGLAGMDLGARALLWVAPWAPSLVAFAIGRQFGVAARDDAHPEVLARLLDGAMRGRCAPDRAAWEAEGSRLREVNVRSVREAVREGGEGAGVEAALLGRDWGFELGEVKVPKGKGGGGVVMWHGGEDRNVPVAMARKAAGLMEGVELRVVEEEGHASLAVVKADEVGEMLKGMMVLDGQRSEF